VTEYRIFFRDLLPIMNRLGMTSGIERLLEPDIDMQPDDPIWLVEHSPRQFKIVLDYKGKPFVEPTCELLPFDEIRNMPTMMSTSRER